MARISKIEVLILMSIIIMLLFQIVHSKKMIPFFQALVVFAAVIVATYAITFSKTLETFDEATPFKASAQVQRDVQIRGSMTSGPTGSPSANWTSSESATDPVFTNMVVYVSALESGFKSTQYRPVDKTLAGDTGKLVICNSTPLLPKPVDSFTLKYDLNSDYNKNGILMSSQIITGPRSMELGFGPTGPNSNYIIGTSPYTIFWYSKNNPLSLSERTRLPEGYQNAKNVDLDPITFFTLHGISKNSSIATRCYLTINVSPSTKGDWTNPIVNSITMTVQHSDQDSMSYANYSLNDFLGGASQFFFDRNYHLYTFVRDDTQMSLYIDNILVSTSHLIDNTAAQLSNKEFLINESGNWDGYLMMFGAYTRALQISDINILIKHIEDIISETTDAYLYATNTLKTLENDLNNSISCPFKGQSFCDVDCINVKDWRYPQYLLQDENKPCLEKVVNYCSKAKTSGDFNCGIWNPTSIAKIDQALEKATNSSSTNAGGNNSITNTTIIQNTNAAAQNAINQIQGVNTQSSNKGVQYLMTQLQNGTITDPATKAQVARMISQHTANSGSTTINLNGKESNDLNTSFAALQSDVNANTYSKLRTVGADMDTEPSLITNIGNHSTLTDDQKYQQILSLYKAEMLKQQGTSGGGFLAWLQNLLGM